jgi:predicted ester cyclase
MTPTNATEEANKAIVLQVLERIFNRNDPSVLEEHPGLSETVAQMSRRAAAFPDLNIRVETLIADGDQVAYVARMKGTHLGVFAGVPATDKPVEYMSIGMDRLENGKIVQHNATGDFLGVLVQLGVLPLKIS